MFKNMFNAMNQATNAAVAGANVATNVAFGTTPSVSVQVQGPDFNMQPNMQVDFNMNPNMQMNMNPNMQVNMQVPNMQMNMNGMQMNSQMPNMSVNMQVPNVQMNTQMPNVQMNMPSVSMNMPGVSMNMPSVSMNMPNVQMNMPTMQVGMQQMPQMQVQMQQPMQQMPSFNYCEPGERLRKLGMMVARDFEFKATARVIGRGELPQVKLNDVIGLIGQGALLDGVKIDSFPVLRITISQEGEKDRIAPNDWMAGENAVGRRIDAVMFEKSKFAAIQYRVWIQNAGWSNWAEQGDWAGQPKSGRWIEAIQCRLPHDRV